MRLATCDSRIKFWDRAMSRWPKKSGLGDRKEALTNYELEIDKNRKTNFLEESGTSVHDLDKIHTHTMVITGNDHLMQQDTSKLTDILWLIWQLYWENTYTWNWTRGYAGDEKSINLWSSCVNYLSTLTSLWINYVLCLQHCCTLSGTRKWVGCRHE